jgi:hypothetical protein
MRCGPSILMFIVICLSTACSNGIQVPTSATPTPYQVITAILPPTLTPSPYPTAIVIPDWPQDYTMTYEFAAFVDCFAVPITIEVRDNQAVSVDTPNDCENQLDEYFTTMTLEKMYLEYISCMADFDDSECSITYTSEGYPDVIELDFELKADDDEIRFRIIEVIVNE